MRKAELWVVGKDKKDHFSDSIDHYTKLIRPYLQLSIKHLPPAKTSGQQDSTQYLATEAKTILRSLAPQDHLVLLDEMGKSMTSHDFSEDLRRRSDHPSGKLIYLIGGAYGFDNTLYARAEAKIRLSEMTMPHRLARLVFIEQLYRACTILANKPYHH